MRGSMAAAVLVCRTRENIDGAKTGVLVCRAAQAKKSPVKQPGFEKILETGVSRGSKETTGVLRMCSQRWYELSRYSLKMP